jgi:hypothetical protein
LLADTIALPRTYPAKSRFIQHFPEADFLANLVVGGFNFRIADIASLGDNPERCG